MDTLELFLDLVDSRSQAHVLAGMGPQAGGQPACRQHQPGSLLSPPLLTPPRSPPSPPGPLEGDKPLERGLGALTLAHSQGTVQALWLEVVLPSVFRLMSSTALRLYTHICPCRPLHGPGRRYYCPPSTDEKFEAQEVKGSAQGHMLGRRSP